MSLLVLSEADVRELLDMESCIAAMEDVLAALARDELTMPLRFVVRPPAEQLLGLMPAHRGGASPLFSLKEVVIAPGNSARGLDPHQGAVLLHDGETGVLEAVANASAITEIRTAAVSAVATKLLARPGARRVAILGAGVQARSHAIAMRAVVRDAELRIWSRTPAHAEALALESHAVVCDTVEEALDSAEVVCTCTSSREPDRPSGLARARHARERGRLVDPDRAGARRRPDRRGGALRRPARVDGQRVGRLPGCRRRSGHRARATSAPSWASCSSGRPTGAVTTTRSRSSSRSGSRSRTSPPPRSASSGRASEVSVRRSSSEPGGGSCCRPARGDRAGARDHGRRRP